VGTDFGEVRAVDAQAFGEPGQRTFRLRILGPDGRLAHLWMEKQQLQALDLALMQVLAQIEYEGGPAEPPEGFPEGAGDEFKVGRMAIGIDQGGGHVVLLAFEAGEEGDEPTLRAHLSPARCLALDLQLKEIIAAGRPICRLCGASIDPGGHACVRANGHSRQPIPREDAPGEE
jgi:uncharacterized repeat protein (TIGR03847 family)